MPMAPRSFHPWLPLACQNVPLRVWGGGRKEREEEAGCGNRCGGRVQSLGKQGEGWERGRRRGEGGVEVRGRESRSERCPVDQTPECAAGA